jgi:hypothetical protein
VRLGLLATATAMLAWVVLELLPLTANPAARHFAASAWILAGVLGVAVFAAYAARAGQPFVRLAEDEGR